MPYRGPVPLGITRWSALARRPRAVLYAAISAVARHSYLSPHSLPRLPPCAHLCFSGISIRATPRERLGAIEGQEEQGTLKSEKYTASTCKAPKCPQGPHALSKEQQEPGRVHRRVLYRPVYNIIAPLQPQNALFWDKIKGGNICSNNARGFCTGRCRTFLRKPGTHNQVRAALRLHRNTRWGVVADERRVSVGT